VWRLCTVGRATDVVVARDVTDLAWDATHALLFAMIQEPSGRYALGAIDPRTGGIGANVTVESPSGLSISDGDQFIYVGNTSSARRYALPGLTDAIVLPNLNGERVAAAPGAPETAAFANGFNLRIVDGTTVRPNAARQNYDEWFTWGIDTTRLYAVSRSAPGIQVYPADASGVTRGSPLGSTPFPNAYNLAFDRIRRRIYLGNGENFDEQGGDPRPFAIGTSDGCKLALDVASGRAFFACAEVGTGVSVRSFDLDSQRLISRIVLSSRDQSTVLAAVRWGSDGLAVAAGSRLYLYSGEFVR
jgi:hypothetical protein